MKQTGGEETKPQEAPPGLAGMRWASWALGIVGVLQYAVMAAMDQPSDYVSLDMSYLVMWLAVIGGLFLCYLSCWGCGEYGGSGSCGCCGDGCGCGDCGNCTPSGKGGKEHGHEGHDHGPGEHGHSH